MMLAALLTVHILAGLTLGEYVVDGVQYSTVNAGAGLGDSLGVLVVETECDTGCVFMLTKATSSVPDDGHYSDPYPTEGTVEPGHDDGGGGDRGFLVAVIAAAVIALAFLLGG